MAEPIDRRKLVILIAVLALAITSIALLWLLVFGTSTTSHTVALSRAQQNDTATIYNNRPPVVGAVAPSGWKTTSTDGTSIELLGIADADARSWWKPDGTPQTSPPPVPADTRFPLIFPPDHAGYRVFVRASWRTQRIILMPKAAPPAHSGAHSGVPGQPTWSQIYLSAPQDEESADLGLVIETEAVETLCDVRADSFQSPHELKLTNNHGTLKFSAIQPQDSSSQLTIEYIAGSAKSPFVGSSNWLILFDAARRPHWGMRDTRDELGPGGWTGTWKFDVPPDKAARFVFGLRPVQYAEFRDVSLRPNMLTKVTVVPLVESELNRAPATRPAAATQP